MRIDGARILLTGASGGLGGSIARELALRGAELVLTARSEAVLRDLADRTGGEVEVRDLSNRDDLMALCESLADVDVLVANAGVGGDLDPDRITTEEIDFVLDVNLRAPMILANEFAQRRTAAGKRGQVVMVGSLSGLVATANTSLYNATKFGLRGYTLAIRQDWADRGIGISLVAPGFIHTAGMAAEGMDLPKFVRTKSPQDVADAVVRAIVTNPAEVFVSPFELRASALMGTVAPGFSEAVQRRLGVTEMARER